MSRRRRSRAGRAPTGRTRPRSLAVPQAVGLDSSASTRPCRLPRDDPDLVGNICDPMITYSKQPLSMGKASESTQGLRDRGTVICHFGANRIAPKSHGIPPRFVVTATPGRSGSIAGTPDAETSTDRATRVRYRAIGDRRPVRRRLGALENGGADARARRHRGRGARRAAGRPRQAGQHRRDGQGEAPGPVERRPSVAARRRRRWSRSARSAAGRPSACPPTVSS